MHRSILVLLLCTCLGTGAELPEPCEKQVAQFLASLKAGHADQAITGFMQDKLRWGGRDEMRQMVSSLQSLTEEVVGKYSGDEIIHWEQLAKDYVTVVVMVKYERQPMFFRFGFYRPRDEFVGDTLNMKSNVAEARAEWLNLAPWSYKPKPEPRNVTVP